MKVSYKKVPTRVLREAASICCSIYAMNAEGARFYAFNCNEKGVTDGEFFWGFDERMKARYSYCIDRERELAGSLSSFRKALRLTSDI